MITGAVFDADGTLLDSMFVWEHLGARYLDTFGIKAKNGLERILAPMSLEEAACYLRNTYHLQQTDPEIIEGVNAVLFDFYSYEVTLKPGVKFLLDALRARQVPMAIATAGERRVIEAALRHLEIAEYFTGIVTCTEAGAGKTKPDVYFAAAGTFPVAGRDIWVLEDAVHAARTARLAGFRVAGVFDASDPEGQTELRALSDFYIENPADFTKFACFATEREEIL